jgi:hypothetical protein
MRFAGQRLELNAVTKVGGEIRVEVLDAGGKPLDGIEKSIAITGDNLRHAVTFTGKTTLASLAGQPVSLRFHLRNAELYAFAFREAK